jgi:hypothetical protein
MKALWGPETSNNLPITITSDAQLVRFISSSRNHFAVIES